MIGIFKQKNPGNTLLLLIYALVLKFPNFLHPTGPLQQPGDHYLYKQVIRFLQSFQLPPVLYSLLAFLLLFGQALLFNRICNAQKMIAKPTYLPAMAFILVSSLFVEWNQFSAPLIINVFLIWIFYRMMLLYNIPKAGNVIYNIGLLLGIVSMLYHPAIVFILLVIFTLFIMRPFRIQEWVIALLGITTPYYFLALILYFSNQWSWGHLLPAVSFNLPLMPTSPFTTISIVLLVIPFIVGGVFVQNNLNKMLIQVRKGWSLLLLFLMISLSVILIDGDTKYVNWILCIVPISAFHAAAYFYPINKPFPLVLHWITFAYALYLNYVLNG
ncbi:MAG: hypothetical protein H7122_17035 [Chitinophagaceae bacterium]|nr:hypothetical protein [Chitinophagaceae bacterium]